MSDKRMLKAEAVASLSSCRYLARKLASHGVDVELNKRDRAVLRGFDRVWLDGWLEDYDIAKVAGLSPADINLLNMVASVETTKKMQQHVSDEQID